MSLVSRDIRSVIARFVPLSDIVRLMCCSKTYRSQWGPLFERRVRACAQASLDARCELGDLLLLFLAENCGVFCFQELVSNRGRIKEEYYGRFWEREGTFHLTATQKISEKTVSRFGKSEECTDVRGVALDLNGKVFLRWKALELTQTVVSHGPFSFNYVEFFKLQLPKYRERRMGFGRGTDEEKAEGKAKKK